MSYDVGNSIGLLNQEFCADYTFWHKSGFLAKFRHDLPRNVEYAINKLIFPLVTHMVYSDTRFGSYGLLKSGRGAEQILDRLDIQVNDQVLRAQEAQILLVF
jgi:hypothetical protein